jgi:hypothetical protein
MEDFLHDKSPGEAGSEIMIAEGKKVTRRAISSLLRERAAN